jgi:hypothetical protein
LKIRSCELVREPENVLNHWKSYPDNQKVVNIYSNDKVHVKDQYFGHWKYHPEIEYDWPEVVITKCSAEMY